MALSFNPPDWLIQDYLRQPTAYEQASAGIQTALKDYLAIDEAKRRNAALAAEAEDRRRKTEMEGRTMFYKYGDPTYLPKEIQAQIGQPAQGPSTEQGEAPIGSPVINHFNEFVKQYPQGLEGMTTDTVMRPLPTGGYVQETIKRPKSGKTILDRASALNAGGEKPRTYQEKQEIYDNEGNPTGYMVFDTKSGQKSYVPYPKNAIPQGGSFGPKVKPQVSAGEVSKLGELENLSQKMSVLMQNYDPSFVGMMDAPLQAIKQKTGFGASEKGAYFRQTSQDIKDSLLRARSGAQINEEEYQRLLPLVPNENSSETDFLAKARRFDEVLNEIYNSKKKSFTEAGYRTGGLTGIKGGGKAQGGAGDPLGIR